ncbi:hypothetical protein GCM10017783_04700 [Deinococcus piscis]|uniref:Cupin 2 conserved barrel domain-containing protein n=1 Tax=Deinococcus piscis TaxID=394230 RepID=A0ABQ3JYJ7_9DEIO|nr:hypothetical protein [Deinococcus piscis]GHF95848.1 hypothetical protein GCM10017783_04700 [Deinococcus piscis]
MDPAPLHLPRLAAATPDTWVTLPAGGLPFVQRALHLTRRLPAQTAHPAGEWLLCLTGDVVVDLPAGQWARLRAGETLHLPPAVTWQALPAQAEAVLLRTTPA